MTRTLAAAASATGPHPRVRSAGVVDAFTPEDRVLLLSACVRLPEEHRAALEALLREPLDWQTILEAARWHRLRGLLYHHLRDPHLRDRVPAQAMAVLRGAYFQSTARYLRVRGALAQALMVLEGEGIPVVLLKGAALVGSLYPEPGMRPMGDLDLLVPRSRLSDAQSAIQRLGFVPAEEGREDHWSQHQHLPRLVSPDSVAIEVHGHVVRLDGPLAFDIEEFWERAVPVAGHGAPASVLAEEDLLLHLCLNFFRDRRFYSRHALGQLCDVAEAVGRTAIDWNALVERARRYGIAGPIACSLQLANRLLGAPLPEGVTACLAPGLTDRDVDAFARLRVVTTRQWVATELVKPGAAYGNVNLARSVLRRIVPTRQYMREKYGGAGIESYWRRLVHVARVLARFLRRPSELTDDLAVDRWVHSLYRGGRGVHPGPLGAESVARE